MDFQGGFHQRVAFVTKDGVQTFDEIGDGIETVVVTKDNKFRKAIIRKSDKKKRMTKITFRRGVFANTDTIVYAADDQLWPSAAREEQVLTSDLKIGSQLWSNTIGPPWEVAIVEPLDGEYDAWTVEIPGEDSFSLRNEIPALSMEVRDEE